MPASDSSRDFRPDLAREFEYLLGQLPRVDRETFQGLLIENPEISARVAEAENELFDAYVRGDMPSAWRPAFEERLLSGPDGKRKLAVARKLTAMGPASPKRVAGWWIFGGAAAASIALVAGVLPNILRPKPNIPAPSVDVAEVRRVDRISLSPVTRGDGARKKIALAAEATHVEFTGLDREAVKVSLTTLQGRELWTATQAPFLADASLLKPGAAYLVTTFDAGGKPLNYYEFEISPRN